MPESPDIRPRAACRTDSLFCRNNTVPEPAESGSGLRVRRGDGLRFGRFALAKEDRQDHQDRGREELALPVLEAFEPELRIAEIGERRNGFLPMLGGLLGGYPGACQP